MRRIIALLFFCITTIHSATSSSNIGKLPLHELPEEFRSLSQQQLEDKEQELKAEVVLLRRTLSDTPPDTLDAKAYRELICSEELRARIGYNLAKKIRGADATTPENFREAIKAYQRADQVAKARAASCPPTAFPTGGNEYATSSDNEEASENAIMNELNYLAKPASRIFSFRSAYRATSCPEASTASHIPAIAAPARSISHEEYATPPGASSFLNTWFNEDSEDEHH